LVAGRSHFQNNFLGGIGRHGAGIDWFHAHGDVGGADIRGGRCRVRYGGFAQEAIGDPLAHGLSFAGTALDSLSVGRK
jgi:hypothetical protein